MISETKLYTGNQMKNKFYTFIFRNRSRNRSQNPQPFPKTCFFSYLCSVKQKCRQKIHYHHRHSPSFGYFQIDRVACLTETISKMSVKKHRGKNLGDGQKMGLHHNELAVNLRKQKHAHYRYSGSGNADSFLYEFHYLCPTGIE